MSDQKKQVDKLTLDGVYAAVKARLKDVVIQYLANNPELFRAIIALLKEEGDDESIRWIYDVFGNDGGGKPPPPRP